MARKITMMSTLIMLIFLSVFLYSGLEKVKAADTEDTIMFPIDGILCHQQAGELFDEINEERAKRGIHELIWDCGYEEVSGYPVILAHPGERISALRAPS